MRLCQSLTHLHRHMPKDVDRRRIRAFFDAVRACLDERSLTLTSLGRGMARGRTTHKHGIKRADRLLGNAHLFAERDKFFRMLTHAALADTNRALIVVDWTMIQNKMWALHASVIDKGRSTTIYFQTAPSKKFVNNRHAQFRFLDALKKLIPTWVSEVVICTDAGFNARWFDKIESLGWHFVGRLSANIGVKLGSARTYKPASSLWSKARNNKAIDLETCLVAKGRPRTRRLVLYKEQLAPTNRRRKQRPCSLVRRIRYRRRHQNPWLLATSLQSDSAQDIVLLYAARMQCEELFRDLKSARFGLGLEFSRCYSEQRATILLLVASVAHAISHAFGTCAEQLDLQRHFQANTAARRTLGRAFVGLRLWAELLFDAAPVLQRLFKHLRRQLQPLFPMLSTA